MKKEHQIGIRVGVPAFFAFELENVYRHTEGVHRALAFHDFCGLLIGLGLDAYRKKDLRKKDTEPNKPIDDDWEWQGEGMRIFHEVMEEA